MPHAHLHAIRLSADARDLDELSGSCAPPTRPTLPLSELYGKKEREHERQAADKSKKTVR